MVKMYQVLKIIILILALAVLLLGAGRLYNSLSGQVQMDALVTEAATTEENQPEAEQEQTEPPRQAAPDFTVYDLEGNQHKLSDYLGKPVVLNFWASWCGPCKSEMPDFNEKFQQYGEDVQFLMVNLTDGNQETVETASGFVTDQGYTFPVFYDTQMEGAIAYGVNSVPVTYFIDAEGNLIARGMGALTADVLQKGMDMLLNP
jgi:thiol-disulfide isomerase/thioredoxin